MTVEQLPEDLERVIRTGLSLRQVVPILHEYRRCGITRHEIQAVLETLREQAQDEAAEDRILEIMDVVSGFCPPEITVWEE